MKILVAGGAGYIGSHTMVELLNEGHDVVCVDNFFNSCIEAVKRVGKITNKELCIKKKEKCINEQKSKCADCPKRHFIFYEGDLLNQEFVEGIFEIEKIDAVMMFAGYKAVGESVQKPMEYYYNNLVSLLTITNVMRKHNCFNIIFSSSATVYGNPEKVPVTEHTKKGDITNPYGKTKSMIEDILSDVAASNNNWKVVLLRYFNPVGAHESGLIGEDPKGIPNNLMPYIARVAVGTLPELHIFGNDYNTKDGTGVRDYIHVVDLAKGHVCALKCFDSKFKSKNNSNVKIYNLGTGNGYSVLEVVKAYEKACKHEIKYVFDERRAGDVAILYCDPCLAKEEIGFNAQYGIEEMCQHSYNFQSKNPNGYVKEDSTKKIKMVFEE